MRIGRKKAVYTRSACFLLCLSLACVTPQLLAKKKDKVPVGVSEQRRALHALNRLTFGPRPGDVQRVMAIGVERWIDLQLHPEKIDDNALSARLEPLRTVKMSTKELAEGFPDGQEINQVMNGKKAMPSDAALRMVYQVQIDRQQEKKEQRQEAAKNAVVPAAGASVAGPSNRAIAGSGQDGSMQSGAMQTGSAQGGAPEGTYVDNSATGGTMNSTGGGEASGGGAKADSAGSDAMVPAVSAPGPKMSAKEEAQARKREEQLYADLDVPQLPNVPPDERFKKILGLSVAGQRAVADSLRGGKGQEFLEGLQPRQKEILQAMNNPGGVVTGELSQAKVLRAIYSERQLDEVMTDFWFNHFNVFMDKGVDRLMITSYERDVIRPHALGKFEDLLVATAKSPAMLFYLDNWLSVGPDSPQGLGIPAHPGPYARRYPQRPRGNQGKRQDGLNENYGRELLELHTLSVNGGYSQQDVTEVAKVFTGWTIEKPYQGGGFKFEPRMHEPGPKVVMGHRIKPKGEGEGLEVLHRLATSPQTAHFISLKLAERFVADDPPPALVDRMAKTFLKKKGDIREVLGVLFHSPEFWDDTTYRAKVKTPLEFVASAVRATGAEVDDAQPLVGQLNRMGMPLYGAQPPTGYSMKAETWVSSSALLTRMNFALALTGGKIRAVKIDVGQLAGNNPLTPPADSTIALSTLENVLLDADVSKQTHDSIVTQIDAGANGGGQKQNNKADARKAATTVRSPDVSTMAGLLLGSPEFQRR
jgi:uncharacterized protein (DUF1800 family)